MKIKNPVFFRNGINILKIRSYLDPLLVFSTTFPLIVSETGELAVFEKIVIDFVKVPALLALK
jgi:hypothetical protein